MYAKALYNIAQMAEITQDAEYSKLMYEGCLKLNQSYSMAAIKVGIIM